MRHLTLQKKSEIIEDCKKPDFIKENILKKYGITENKLTGILRNQKQTNHLKTAIGGSENLGVPVLFGGHNLPHLVEVGLTDLTKSGVAPPGTTPLIQETTENDTGNAKIEEEILEEWILDAPSSNFQIEKSGEINEIVGFETKFDASNFITEKEANHERVGFETEFVATNSKTIKEESLFKEESEEMPNLYILQWQTPFFMKRNHIRLL